MLGSDARIDVHFAVIGDIEDHRVLRMAFEVVRKAGALDWATEYLG